MFRTLVKKITAGRSAKAYRRAGMPDAKQGSPQSAAILTHRTGSGLVIEASTSAEGGVLREFYSDYDKAFVLENEKEEFDGFAECLALNYGPEYLRLSTE